MTESRDLLGDLSGGLASGPHGRYYGRPRNLRSSVHPDTSGLSQVAALGWKLERYESAVYCENLIAARLRFILYMRLAQQHKAEC